MRPESLYPLFAPLSALPGIGPRTAPLFEKLAGPSVVDLAWHLPGGVVDRRFTPTIAEAPANEVATITVTVMAHQPGATVKRPYRVVVGDPTGTMVLVYFHARADWLAKLLPVGAVRVVSGMVEFFNDEKHMTHPDHVVAPAEAASVMRVEPVYPLSAGLSQKVMGKVVQGALARLPDLPEWLDGPLMRREGWGTWKESLLAAHAPGGRDDLSPLTPAKRRLAYDELLANQLALALVRRAERHRSGRAVAGSGETRARIVAALPFRLTGAQARSVEEIAADMAAPQRMLRLLQGDVGSGKTVVALLAMAAAAEAGLQSALMAPTELLARQHHATLSRLAEGSGLRLALLTGRDKGQERERILLALKEGAIDILVGTHALFQGDVVFHDLALAVIDEQHRFGVQQRVALGDKGLGVDTLVMTATPIPRTLVLTAHGDMDVSRLDEKPPGRKPVDTRVIPLSRLDEVVAGLERALEGGGKVYWVCPLIEESETLDMAAVEERHSQLQERLGSRVGLVHGRMKGPARDAVMQDFAGGGIDILVATTVIEVGVDVPAATTMVVEHAERFGLAQLHQLRGRVGRGSGRSTCLLLYGTPLGETAKARLATLRESEDGFFIAEQDLALRGAGEVLGTRQSGMPKFRLADLDHHGELLAIAGKEARLIVETDPELEGARGGALRTLLYLFRQDALIKTMRSG